jgi:hypothetical protein
MADDNPYKFDWWKQPAVKSLAKIKRNPETWNATSPSQVEGIGQQYATDKRQVFSEDAQGQGGDAMVANPNITPAPIPEENPNVAASAPSPTAPPGPVMNPHTGGEASSLSNWLNAGGSIHTFHNKQVAQGLRPAIDGRATVSPQEGMNGNAGIRAGWGWEPEQFGQQGSAYIGSGGAEGESLRRNQLATQKSQLLALQAQRLAQAQSQVNTPASGYNAQ